ncbi:phage major capsid protein [Bacillus massiliglaciei]|uniref:phage major capsid protein n=1 Tax=Bacillus massiliglaciei TaxID=1816693 RepID=UPI000ABD280A|nr:phage major capsid protein [Bacillus massiliglaciei]
MVMRFNNKNEMNDAKKKLTEVLSNTESTESQQTEAFTNYFDELQREVTNNIRKEVQAEMYTGSHGANQLSGQEIRFFNAVIQEGGFKDNETLPVETQERVFEDLQQSHPLLQQIGIQNLGAVTEFIYGNPEGAAVWGPIFGDIKGQLNATFRKESISQLKLTAFIPISNDMLKLGPVWVERYVRTMIVEAMSVGLERGFVEGTGDNQPIGLLKDLNGSVENGVMVYPDKTSAGTLTFKPGRTTINELKGVVEKLSIHTVGSEDRVRNIAGKVVMVTNPFDSFGIKANSTVQNAAGSYVSSLPFSPIFTESMFVPQGKVLFFVKGEYLAAIGGEMEVKKFDQTLAMDDATLYIAKQFATGKPKDNQAVQVYDLDLAITEEPAGA